MQTKRVSITVVVIVVLGVAGYLCWLKFVSNQPRDAISIRYTGEKRGATTGIHAGRNDIFWVTNHTDKKLMVFVREIEILSNGIWITKSQPLPGLLYFTNQVNHQTRNEGYLAPHAEGYGAVIGQRLSLPRHQTWRAKVSVGEQLTGIEGVVSAAQDRLLAGNTTVAINPFNTNFQYWRSTGLLSDPVVAQ